MALSANPSHKRQRKLPFFLRWQYTGVRRAVNAVIILFTDKLLDSTLNSSPFQNLALTPAQLPLLEQLQWQALSARYMPLHLWLTLLSTALFTLLWLAILWQPFWPLADIHSQLLLWLGGLASSLGLLSAVYYYLALPRQAYALRQHDLSFRSGLFFHKMTTQPLLRVQHIELKQGPLERWAGLATLQVYSAGGSTHTFQIPGLPDTEAQAIRQLILQHKDMQQHG